jgi:ABC-2 type transport system ATP-binding protein
MLRSRMPSEAKSSWSTRTSQLHRAGRPGANVPGTAARVGAHWPRSAAAGRWEERVPLTEAVVQTQGLTRDYGGRGIFDLDLRIEAGEIFGLIGPNGAGKTTTMRLLLDLIRPDRGQASILGLDSHRDAVAIHRRTGYLPAELPDYPNQRGGRILDLLANLRGGVEPERITALAGRLNLDLGRRYREYSSGNRQKLWLIHAFMHDPDLLILDEPTSGLDPLMQQNFKDLVHEAQRRGATVLLSSHVLPEVQELCGRIAVVHEGRLRRVGTMEELRITGRRQVTAHLERAVDRETLARLPGVDNVVITGTTIGCTVAGSMDQLMRCLAPCGIASLESDEMSLEDLFLADYGRASAE